MIQDYYGLTTNAFSLSPDLDFVFVSQAHEEALAHLAYGLEQNEDITLIIGDIGTGKTLALHRLLSQVAKSFVPVYITVTQMDFEQLMELIMMKLGVPIPSGKGLAALLHSFEEYLIVQREKGQRVLLVIDEAQNLPIDTLESVRMIMNLAQPGKPVLQLILVGQLDLGQKLDLHKMRQLRQRIRVEYKLSLLSRKEMEAYIVHRLEVAGRADKLFKNSALDKIFKFSNGVPRLVNHLVTTALVNGFVAEAKMISGRHVEELQGIIPEDTDTDGLDLSSFNVDVEHAPSYQEKSTPRENSQPKSRKGLLVFATLVILAFVGFATQSVWRPMLDENGKISESSVPQTPVTGLNYLENEVSDSGGQVVLDSLNVEFAKTVEPTIPAQVVSFGGSSYIGHIASFRDEDLAVKFCNGISGSTVEAFYKLVDIGDGDLWYRVYLGPFDTEELAREACASQKNQGSIQYYSITEIAMLDSL